MEYGWEERWKGEERRGMLRWEGAGLAGLWYLAAILLIMEEKGRWGRGLFTSSLLSTIVGTRWSRLKHFSFSSSSILFLFLGALYMSNVGERGAIESISIMLLVSGVKREFLPIFKSVETIADGAGWAGEGELAAGCPSLSRPGELLER